MPSPIPVTYIFCGQDVPSLREQLEGFCASLGDPSVIEMNTTKFEGKTVTAGEIEAAARSAPFLADMRLVIVDELTASASGRAVIEQMSDMIPALPDWTRLVFVETGLDEGDSVEAGKRSGGRPQALKKLINLVESGDVVIGLSGSGMSPNVINAFHVANEAGASTVLFSGFRGGHAREVADESIVVPCDDMQQIEDVHMILTHVIFRCVREQIRG